MKMLMLALVLMFPLLSFGEEIHKLYVMVGVSEIKEGEERHKTFGSIAQYPDIQLELKKVAGQDDKGLGLPPPGGATTEYSATFSRTTQKLKLPVKFQIRKFVEADPRIFRYELITTLDGLVISNMGLRSLDGMMNVQSWGAPIDVDGTKYDTTVQVLFDQKPMPPR